MTKEDIRILCDNYNISKYTINDDMSIDVDGVVNLTNRSLYKIPLKFNKVNGHFYCNTNSLTTLKGCPYEVNGIFDCSNNKITSLEGMPSFIRDSMVFYNNYIKSFKGMPEYIDTDKHISMAFNPINRIYRLFDFNVKAIYWLNEYDVIQGNNIILDRFEEVFIQLNMYIPNMSNIDIQDYNIV